VHEATLIGAERTNNLSEGWNRGFSDLVNESQLSFWKALSNIKKDEAVSRTNILQLQLGTLPAKRQKREH